MTLTSNLEGVIGRVRRMQTDIPSAMTACLAPDRWREVMELEARRTLWKLARPEEWRSVDMFLRAIFTGGLAEGFFSAMNNPVPPTMAVEDFAIVNHMQLTQVKDGQGGPGLFSKLLNQFDQMMVDWVATEKRKDARDWDKSDEEIGQWIGQLLLTPDSKLSERERKAKAALMPHIVSYIQRRQEERRLSDATVNAWLRAVLAAWCELVRREFPRRLTAQLAAQRAELPLGGAR